MQTYTVLYICVCVFTKNQVNCMISTKSKMQYKQTGCFDPVNRVGILTEISPRFNLPTATASLLYIAA